MATILTKRSNTASSVPLAADLTNSTSGAELAVNTADKRVYTKDSAGNVVELGTNPSSLALPSGSVNGVGYLNASKQFTTGSALTFDGTNFANSQSTASPIGFKLNNGSASPSAGTRLTFQYNGGDTGYVGNQFDGTDFNNQYAANRFHIWLNGGSEQMRLTSTGLGIGTSSPAYKLDVSVGTNTIAQQWQGAGTNFTLRLKSGTGATPSSSSYRMYLDYLNGTATNGYVDFYRGGGGSDGWLVFGTSGTDRMTLDSSGNLGLGATPSAWTSFNAFEMSNGVYVGSYTPSSGLYAGANSYYNAGWKYKATGVASQYIQTAGQHQWYTAPSGTAGNAISFTQAMTLDTSGNFQIGGTTNGTGFQVVKDATYQSWYSRTNHPTGTPSGYGYADFLYNTSGIGSITQAGTTGVLYNVTSDYRLKDIAGPVTNSGAFIDKLNPVQGSWKADGSRFIGFLAHELQEASETVVGTGVKDGEEMQSIDYSNAELIANFAAELKSLRQRLAAAGL